MKKLFSNQMAKVITLFLISATMTLKVRPYIKKEGVKPLVGHGVTSQQPR